VARAGGGLELDADEAESGFIFTRDERWVGGMWAGTIARSNGSLAPLTGAALA
jgi:hypothetical protein